MTPVDLAQKFSLFSDHWRPRTVGELNGQEVKVVKVQGTFVWRGRLRIEFRDRAVELGPGQFFIVPHGIEHRTAADEEAEVVIFEPRAVRNTGNVVDEHFTAPMGQKL